MPLHSSPVGKEFGFKQGDLPVTEELSGRLLRLPFYPQLTEDEQLSVVKLVTAFLQGAKVKSPVFR